MTLVGNREVLELVAHWPQVAQIFSIERPEIATLFGVGELEAARRFLAPFDRIYSWLASGDPLFTANLARAASGHVRLLPFAPRAGSEPAALHYLRTLGLSSPRMFPLLRPSKEADRWAAAAWRRWKFGRRPVLVMHPGAGARSKRWHRRGFQDVAAWWVACRGPVLTLLGPAESDEKWAEITSHQGGGANVLSNAPLSRVTAVLARARAYVGNDCGISHVAGLVGSRGVVLFGPTDPARWRPAGERLEVLRATGPGGAAGEISREAVSVESVISALERLS